MILPRTWTRRVRLKDLFIQPSLQLGKGPEKGEGTDRVGRVSESGKLMRVHILAQWLASPMTQGKQLPCGLTYSITVSRREGTFSQV